MLDAGMDAHEWPGGDDDEAPAREALGNLFIAMLNAGYDADTVELILLSPAAFLGVEFVPVGEMN
jgi:hypothetical protein